MRYSQRFRSGDQTNTEIKQDVRNRRRNKETFRTIFGAYAVNRHETVLDALRIEKPEAREWLQLDQFLNYVQTKDPAYYFRQLQSEYADIVKGHYDNPESSDGKLITSPAITSPARTEPRTSEGEMEDSE
jgi:hypothetical protein